MEYFKQAQQLILNTRQRLESIRAEYEASIREQEVRPDLLIQIKNFLENLRSALDYSAHGLVERWGRRPTRARDTYFPYASPSDDVAEFRKKVERNLPGVSATRPDILRRLELAQHFYGPGSNWLLGFMQLVNENKHQSLTPQKRGRFKRISFSIRVPPNSTIEVPWPPQPNGAGQTDVKTFDSFAFTSNGVPVVFYLETILNCVQGIVDDLANM